MNKGELMELLGKYNNVDSARPISFDYCVSDVKDGKRKDSNCGFHPDVDQIVWDYQDPKRGEPTHLGEELYNQVMQGIVVVIPIKQYRKAIEEKYGIKHDELPDDVFADMQLIEEDK